jgi:excisionase family DNA binding protein
MRRELETAMLAARTISPEELPRLLGDLEEVKATALARLIAPPAAQTRDRLLDIGEAAKRLAMSQDYLYRNHSRLPFTRKVGRSLRFSEQGIERYLRR